MSTGTHVAAGLVLGAALASGCSAEPPRALRHLPRDADALWGVDLGALAAWPGLEAPGPLASLHAPQLRDGLGECGLDPTRLLVVGAGRTPDRAVAVVSGPGVGTASALACVGEARWRGEGQPAWWTIDDEGRLHGAAGGFVGRATDDDTLVVAGDPGLLEAALVGDDAPWPAEIRAAIGDVDFSAVAWAVAVHSDGSAAVLPDAHSAALTVTLGEEISLRAIVRTSNPGASERVASELEVGLHEVARWVYAPPTVVDRAELTRADDRVELALALPLAQWRGLDLRFVDERRGLASPPRPSDDAPEVSVLRRLSVATADVSELEPPPEPEPEPEPETAVVAGPTGLAACDEYLTKYRRCIEDHLPESVREQAAEALDASVDAWKIAASTPSARASLEVACQTALEATAEATRAMGCAW
jgi:hypothetical protein